MNKTEFEIELTRIYNLENDSLYPPEIDDLWFLYSLVRDKCVTSILEYGTGWSTYAMAIGLYENFQDFGSEHMSSVRHPNPFMYMNIDSHRKYQEIAINRLPSDIRNLISLNTAISRLTTLDGAICHKYDFVPNFAADLIYLDGPDHDDVIGEIDGFKYKNTFTQPMGIDLLMIEPFLWPEAIIVSDGRTANARFLASRFKREWEVMLDPFGERTIFRLSENPLGVVSLKHINFRLTQSRKYLNKEKVSGTNEWY
jgi:hypothetical protein